MASIWDRLEDLADRPLTSVERSLLFALPAFPTALVALLVVPAVSGLQAVIGAVLATIAVFFIAFTFLREPRARRGAIGVLVALAPESDEHAKQIRSDFVQQLRRLTDSSGASKAIDVVEYSPRASRLVVDAFGAEQAAGRSRCQLIVFGEARIRHGKHVVTPRLLVTHRRIPLDISKRFGETLTKILPAQIIIAGEVDFLGFALASRMVAGAARYAIGVAMGFAGEYELAIELFEQAETDASGLPPNTPQGAVLRDSIKGRLAEIHGIRALRAIRRWDKTRDMAILAEAEVHYDDLLAIRPRSEGGLVGKAICAFVRRRDMVTVKRCINKCSNSTTATWRYSEAFICLYEGKLDRARAAYRAAARMPTTEDSDYLQSEQFLVEVLGEEPDKYQLWFGVGMINLVVKEDYGAAAQAFAKFKAADAQVRYRKYHVWAETQLEMANATGKYLPE